MKKIISTIEDLKDFALDLLEILPQDHPVGVVVALSGDLGAGKTTLTKEIAKILGVKETVSSPTFVLMRKYKIPSKNSTKTNHNFLIHIDAYRMDDPKELERLGWEEMINNPENLIFIEWPEKVPGIIPKKHIKVELAHKGENKRSGIIKNKNAQKTRTKIQNKKGNKK